MQTPSCRSRFLLSRENDLVTQAQSQVRIQIFPSLKYTNVDVDLYWTQRFYAYVCADTLASVKKALNQYLTFCSCEQQHLSQ